MDDAPAARAIRRTTALGTQRPESRPQLFHEELRLFKCGKVPALVEPVVVDELGIRPFCPAPRSWIELVGKDAHGNRNGHALDTEIAERVLPSRDGPRNPPCSSTT